jgi:putative DNA primase/helicase
MMAAIITQGGTFPGCDQKAPLGNVIVLNAEDRDEDTLVPRLAAAGADMKRVFIVQAAKDKGNARKFSLITDLDKLRKLAADIGDVKLITFDPVSSYLGGDLDSHSNTELRNALDPITQMANDTGAAVLSVTRFNK